MRDFDSKQMFDDMARLATGAVGAMSGFRQHLRQEVKSHLDRFLVELDLVPRSDFETVEQMAKQARAENAELKRRLDEMEGRTAAVHDAKYAFKNAAPETAAAPKKTAKKPPAEKA